MDRVSLSRHSGPMEDKIPVVVRMHVDYAECGHTEDDTYEFDLPIAKAQPKEEFVHGECPECVARVRIYLIRTQDGPPGVGSWQLRAPPPEGRQLVAASADALRYRASQRLT